jgi:hypothetical protein
MAILTILGKSIGHGQREHAMIALLSISPNATTCMPIGTHESQNNDAAMILALDISGSTGYFINGRADTGNKAVAAVVRLVAASEGGRPLPGFPSLPLPPLGSLRTPLNKAAKVCLLLHTGVAAMAARFAASEKGLGRSRRSLTTLCSQAPLSKRCAHSSSSTASPINPLPLPLYTSRLLLLFCALGRAICLGGRASRSSPGLSTNSITERGAASPRRCRVRRTRV